MWVDGWTGQLDRIDGWGVVDGWTGQMDRIDGWGGGWMGGWLVTPIGLEFATTGSGAGGSGPTEKKEGGSPHHCGTP